MNCFLGPLDRSNLHQNFQIFIQYIVGGHDDEELYSILHYSIVDNTAADEGFSSG